MDWDSEIRFAISAFIAAIPFAFYLHGSAKSFWDYIEIVLFCIGLILLYVAGFGVAYAATKLKYFGVAICVVVFFIWSANFVPKLNSEDRFEEYEKQIFELENKISRYEDAEQYYKMICDEYGVDVYEDANQ